MESNDELKEIDIKNCTCYYFDDILRAVDINIYKLLLEERSCENNLIYGISYKACMGGKSLRIRFDKIDGFIKIYDVTRYSI